MERFIALAERYGDSLGFLAWQLMDYKDKIADIKHARRTTSKLKCKINDAQERVTSNFKLKSSKIDKQPRLSVNPRLCTYNIEAKMLQKKRTGSYQMKRKASSKSKASSVSPNYILRTSPDDVTHFFFHSVVLERCHLERSWLERSRVYQRKIFSVAGTDFLYYILGEFKKAQEEDSSKWRA